MTKAQRKAILIVKKVLPQIVVAAGLKESDVADQIKSLLKKYGARPAFRIIVASGKRSAKPHGFATNKVIKRGDLVVVDFGALYNGYRSDITRTFVVGKPSKKQRNIFKIVRQAQKMAIKATKSGVKSLEVDQAARGYIIKQGYGKNFIHTTGHGVGRRVHEAPKLSAKNRTKLKIEQVLAIEPGIYIKGWGGVRIEDMFLVTKKGAKCLTS